MDFYEKDLEAKAFLAEHDLHITAAPGIYQRIGIAEAMKKAIAEATRLERERFTRKHNNDMA